MTSLTTSGWQLSKFKNGRKCRIRRLRCCISREPFELERPNFTGTSTPNCPTFAPVMTSLCTSGRKLQRKKTSTMPPQTASGGISREKFKRGSPNCTRLSRTSGLINLPEMTSLVASDRLQNAIKLFTKVVAHQLVGILLQFAALMTFDC